jgi:hypothetical protein
MAEFREYYRVVDLGSTATVGWTGTRPRPWSPSTPPHHRCVPQRWCGGHKDPRTTRRHDRSRDSLDRNGEARAGIRH